MTTVAATDALVTGAGTGAAALRPAVVQGVVLFTATAYILLNLVADILYAVANPRMRIG